MTPSEPAATPARRAGAHHGRPGGAARRGAAALTAAGVLLAPLSAVAVLAVMGSLAPGQPGLRDPGALTRWGVPVVTTLRDVAAAMTIGLLTLAVLTMQTRETLDTDDLGAQRLRVVRIAGAMATTWLALSALLVVLTYSQVAAVGVGQPRFADDLAAFVLDVEPGRLLAGSCVLVAAVAVGARITTTLPSTVLTTLAAVGALLPIALSGHAAGDVDHASAVSSMVVHLLGVTVWSGGLAGLVLMRVALRFDVAAPARRFSMLAGAAFVAVAVSGGWRLLVRVDSPDQLLSVYGAIAGAKVVLLAALGVAGAFHRRRTLRLLDGTPDGWAPFLRLAVGELVIMAVATGLGVALARTPLG